MIYLKLLTLTLLLLGFVSSSQSQSNRHIHILKVLDTNNKNINVREGCKSIQYTFEDEILRLAKNIDIPKENINHIDVIGEDFTLKKLKSVLEYDKRFIDSGDIVFFIYVGHGFRNTSDDKIFPNFFFGSMDDTIHYDDVKFAIAEEEPSIFFSMVISCNKDLDPLTLEPPVFDVVNNAPEPFKFIPDNPSEELEPGVFSENYLQLYSYVPENLKTIEFLSAKQGYLTVMDKFGGRFFNEFLLSYHGFLSDKDYDDEISWGLIGNETIKQTKMRSTNTKQVPYFNYYLQKLKEINVVFDDDDDDDVIDDNPLKKDSCKSQLRRLKKENRVVLKRLRREYNDAIRKKKQERPKPKKSTLKVIRMEYKKRKIELKALHDKMVERKEKECYGY